MVLVLKVALSFRRGSDMLHDEISTGRLQKYLLGS